MSICIRNRRRFAVITMAFLVLSVLHISLDLTVGGLASDFTKGLPVVFLFVCMCIWGMKHPRVILALLFSFLGDYAAETPLPGHTAFHMQIAFFAVAQICYILEFLRYCPVRTRNSGKVLGLTPVLCGIYGLLVLSTAVVSTFQQREHKRTIVAGAFIFLVSDSLILVRMLTGGFPCQEIAVMGTYYLAQYLLSITFLTSDKD